RLLESERRAPQPADRDQQAPVHGRGHAAEVRGIREAAGRPRHPAEGNQGIAMSVPIEISPPDIKPWKQGNTGIDYVHVLDSGKPGPNVMVQALTHGNEFCGAIALKVLFEESLRPKAGKLTLVFANVAAYERFDPSDPSRSRYIDEDLNRVWGDD